MTAVFAVAFWFGHLVRDAGGVEIVVGVLFTLFLVFATASTVYLMRFCVKDVFGHRIFIPCNRCRHRSPDEEVDNDARRFT